jgi:hypothetical protein
MRCRSEELKLLSAVIAFKTHSGDKRRTRINSYRCNSSKLKTVTLVESAVLVKVKIISNVHYIDFFILMVHYETSTEYSRS